ncbi:MAG: YvcK family protein [Candidatus Omnitrophota bacterium]|nr:MAG: YvcK family protein [Candidatus Omnitrophota bacterium]
MKGLKKLRWLYPGIRIKRWILLIVLGIIAVIFGAARFIGEALLWLKTLDAALIFLGITLIVAGVRSMVKSFVSVFLPSFGEDLVDIIYKKRYLERGPRMVTIGGGHGLATLLAGLKEYSTNVNAVVTVADSGGSTGRLRQEFDVLAPGDIRNCIVALADVPSLMGELFQFRFKKDSELKGHNFGNLFITAMTQLTGDFEKAVEESSKVLAIRGKVLPSTLNKVNLVAEYKDGSRVEGEAEIPEKKVPIERVYLNPTHSELQKKIRPASHAIEAIENAQIIIIGPGSLYTSILPNLVIKEISEAIAGSSALKIYVCNVMSQHGETDDYSASEHLKAIIKHTQPKIIDYCIVNTKVPQEEALAKYREEKAFPVKADSWEIRRMGYKVIEGNVIHAADFVRHDPKRLAQAIMNIFRRETIRREF